MGLLDKIKKIGDMIVPYSEDELTEVEEWIEEEEAEAADTSAVSQQKVVGGQPMNSFTTAQTYQRPKLTPVAGGKAHEEMRIKLFKPENFDNVSVIADALKAKSSAIVNYERLELAEQRRICDFLNGVCYVQNGEVQRITATMVLYVPNGVDIDKVAPVQPAAD